MSYIETLPQEIVTDILARLPVRSLCRFRCVSPSWNSLISDPHFAKTHLHRAKTLNPKHVHQKVLIVSGSSNLYSVDFADANLTAIKLNRPTMEQQHTADKRVRVLTSWDGLLLACYESSESDQFLLNPCTSECKKLPTLHLPFDDPPVIRDLYGMGYDPCTDDYKVAMLSRRYGSSETMTDVYSLKTNAWRRIENCQYSVWGSSSCGAFLNGCLHGLFWKDIQTDSCVIISFNLSDEIFREMPLPASLCIKYGFNIWVDVVRGCLGLVYGQARRRTKVMMMKEYGVIESWTSFTITLPSGIRSRYSLCWFSEEEYLFFTFTNTRGETRKKLFMYNMGKQTLRDLAVAGIPGWFTFGGSYVESLISPNHVM